MDKKPRRASIAILAVLGGALLFLLIYFGHGDDRKMAEFAAAYGKFDGAISDYAARPGPDSERRADEALAGLKAGAAMRLSSLTQNDAELMTQAREVADLAGREVESRRAFLRAARDKDRDADGLARATDEWADKRRAAWTRYRGLGGEGEEAR